MKTMHGRLMQLTAAMATIQPDGHGLRVLWLERVPRGAWSPDGSQVVFRCRSRAGPTPPFKPCISKLNGTSFRSFPWPLASAEPGARVRFSRRPADGLGLHCQVCG
jgi:hypothetical protein